MPWPAFVGAIGALPAGTLWRHNQAGDLPGIGETIDAGKLQALTLANAGKAGFTYTHKPTTPANAAAIKAANEGGMTINLSANSLAHADQLSELGIAPVVVVLPAAIKGSVRLATPAGRKGGDMPSDVQGRHDMRHLRLVPAPGSQGHRRVSGAWGEAPPRRSMTPDQQYNFVRELIGTVEAKLLAKIDRVPGNWDAHELRQWISDAFAEIAAMSTEMNAGRSVRRRDYRNTVRTLGL